jgi:Family of unknown function (DUF6163)
MRRNAPARRLLELEPLPAIASAGANGAGQSRTRWTLIYVWFCRVCSVLWLLAGLLQWAFILGVIEPPGISFDSVGARVRLATGFFAVVDIVAAVGLWLTAPWGGTVWLLSAAAQVAFPFALHDYGGANAATISINTILVLAFVGINYMIRRKS